MNNHALSFQDRALLYASAPISYSSLSYSHLSFSALVIIKHPSSQLSPMLNPNKEMTRLIIKNLMRRRTWWSPHHQRQGRRYNKSNKVHCKLHGPGIGSDCWRELKSTNRVERPKIPRFCLSYYLCHIVAQVLNFYIFGIFKMSIFRSKHSLLIMHTRR